MDIVAYDNYTQQSMDIGQGFNFKPIDIDDVLYTLPDIIYKFRTAIKEPAIRKVFLGSKYGDYCFPSLGFCGIISYSLKILFPQLELDSTADMSHVWNVYKGKILDVTGDQFVNSYDLQDAYKESTKNKKTLFRRSIEHTVARQHNMLLGEANLFISYVFGWRELE